MLAISRRVTPGDSSASPRATTRMASTSSVGLGVLDQEAAGPGAERVEDVLVDLERGQDDRRARRPGRDRRRSAGWRPGRRCRASGCPSARRRRRSGGPARPPRRRRRPRRRPRCRAPAPTSTRKPARTSAWSSASRTRIIGGPASGRRARHGRSRLPGARPASQGAAQRRSALPHPGQPGARAVAERGGTGAPSLMISIISSSPSCRRSRSRTRRGRGARRWSATPARCGRRPARPAAAAGPGLGPLGDGEPAAVVASTSAGCRAGRRHRRAPPAACRSTSVSPAARAGPTCWPRGWPGWPRRAAGSAASSMPAAVACTLIIAIEWATTSCSSRAIRIRSASTRRRVSSSRVSSACAARSARRPATCGAPRRSRRARPRPAAPATSSRSGRRASRTGRACPRPRR